MEDVALEIEGIIVDVDYINIDTGSSIRLTLKSKDGIYTILDPSFHPYFYLVPFNKDINPELILKMQVPSNSGVIKVESVEKCQRLVKGKTTDVLKVRTYNAHDIPALSEHLTEFGERFEYDVLYWKRYLIDKGISPLSGARVTARKEDGRFIVSSIKPQSTSGIELTKLCFDIETYNPATNPRPDADPVIMISYKVNDRESVLTTRPIKREFVEVCANEKDMIEKFIKVVRGSDPDVIAGYNSSGFDIPYLLSRAKKYKLQFNITRYDSEEARTEHHGLIEAVKIPGRVNADIYNITKFVSIVGASEKLLKINRFKLGDVYAAITGDTSKGADKEYYQKNTWKIWDGSDSDREGLADYSLSDSKMLEKLYDFFIPLETEVAKVCGTTLGEAAISTTGQLVEFLLMRYANDNGEMIPNKPSESAITERNMNPIEGAYVKTPEAGIYDNIVVFDFRGLYPSIIIANNIDPSTICKDCTEDYYESPLNVRFRKAPEGIVPKALRLMIAERTNIKRAYKKDPDNKPLAARSQALKIIANSFYGYLGYARSRWYSRDCAASVTAYGRESIMNTMDSAEKAGFPVLYSDTDSTFLLMKGKTKEEAISFLDKVNRELPKPMELELEDFYVRGVFVGKKGADGGSGAKKKYALLSESGRVKIRGFELVRRDWSFVAREAQRQVLEAILKEGSKSKAIGIVKGVIQELKSGKTELRNLVIYTQLRKKIDRYDANSPELAAAKKAIEKKVKRKEDIEGSTIGYIITKEGNSISDKAQLEEIATSYDPDYYINNQVIPATLKILKELGFSEEELKGGGSQKRLGA